MSDDAQCSNNFIGDNRTIGAIVVGLLVVCGLIIVALIQPILDAVNGR